MQDVACCLQPIPRPRAAQAAQRAQQRAQQRSRGGRAERDADAGAAEAAGRERAARLGDPRHHALALAAQRHGPAELPPPLPRLPRQVSPPPS